MHLIIIFFVHLIIRDSVIPHVMTKIFAETGNNKCAISEIQSTYDCVAYSSQYARFEHSKLSVLPLGTLVK